ncbi:MAG: ABC transporter substrate-binding protein [Actinomycetota bacterium]
MNSRKPLIAAVAGTAVIALVAGCSSSKKKEGGSSSSKGSASSSQAAGGKIINPGFTTKGGTVQILANANFEHLDPVQNYVTNSGNFGRIIYRTLTFVKDTPGEKPEIKPDLAENLGVSSDNGATWTYKIRKGLKFEDGTPITAKDIKYGIERSFASDIYQDGATYMADLLKNDNGYAGPYKDPNKDLTSVATPDDHTMVFHFTGPQPDANWIMSLFYTVPVPKAKDDKQNYDLHPVSSGPYKISQYTPDKSITLVRNTNWDPATDPNRPALPDSFVVTEGIDLPTISQRLIADQGPDKNATTLENSGAIQNGDLPKIREESVKKRFTNGPTPCIDYEWINTQKVTDPTVRKAIALAINRQAIQTIYGGDLFGRVTDTIISSTIEGYAPADLGLKPGGDPAAAKALLAGKSVPTLHYGVSSTSVKQKTVATQLQNDLKAAGINVVIDQIPGKSYYKTLRSDKAPDMGRAGWCWDWPTSSAIVPAVLGPDSSGKKWSSNNFSKWFDATISADITKLASSTASASEIGKQFNDVTNKILSTAWPLIPTIDANDPNVVGSNLQNAGVSTIFGSIDMNTIGVKQ